jgi:hypothetical protein
LNNSKSWWASQFSLIKSFIEITLTIFLDATLIVILGWIRKLVLRLIGIDPSTIKDRQIFWVVRITEISTIVAVGLYVISDFLRHIAKIFKEIKQHFKDNSPR